MWGDRFVPDYAEFIEEYPPGSDGFANASRIYCWSETNGTLYKQELFRENCCSTGWQCISCGIGARALPWVAGAHRGAPAMRELRSHGESPRGGIGHHLTLFLGRGQ